MELEDRKVEREREKQSRNGKRFHGKHVFIFCNPEASAFQNTLLGLIDDAFEFKDKQSLFLCTWEEGRK